MGEDKGSQSITGFINGLKAIPEYLKLGWRESRWQRVAKFRLEGEMRGNRCWDGRAKKV